MQIEAAINEFLYEQAPFPSCHAATLADTGSGLVASFFGGTRERNPDVCIWVVRHVIGAWTEPMNVADGVQADGTRQPTWNPVLFQPRGGPLMLFYKVGPSPSTWWGMVKESHDDGRTWGEARRLPDGILGPIKNKPVQLADGTILSPSSTESAEHGWRIHFERSTDNGRTWTATPPVNQPEGMKCIQPSILIHSDGRLQAVGRTKSKKLFSTWSSDQGKTWAKITLLDVPNPNSGTDAVTLQDGRHLLVYNHSDTFRYPLNVAVSNDGIQWDRIAVLDSEPTGQYSYPCIIQAEDGLVHIAYTWKRLKMKYAMLDLAAIDAVSVGQSLTL